MLLSLHSRRWMMRLRRQRREDLDLGIHSRVCLAEEINFNATRNKEFKKEIYFDEPHLQTLHASINSTCLVLCSMVIFDQPTAVVTADASVFLSLHYFYPQRTFPPQKRILIYHFHNIFIQTSSISMKCFQTYYPKSYGQS